MAAKKNRNTQYEQYIEFQITTVDFLHGLDYGQPACAIIENEYGIIPISCLTHTEKVQYDNQQRLKLVRESIQDSEQHYDIDGVSSNIDQNFILRIAVLPKAENDLNF